MAHETLTPLVDDIQIPRNAVRASDATTTSDRTVYPIAVNDIVPFARRIMDVSQKPTPLSVLKALGRAIPSRRQFTDWYTNQGISDPSLEASNRSHDYFNGVLDELLEVLTLHSVEASNERIGDVGAMLEAETASQKSLGDLEIESLSQEVPTELLTPDGRTSLPDSGLITEPQPQAVPSQDAYEVEDPAEYVQFAVFNTTKDLHLLRQYIHILLDRYVVKDISLLSLSAIINTAIGAVRRTEKDLMESLPEYSSWEMVMETLVSPPQFEAVITGSSEYIDTTPQKEFLDSLYCLPFEELRRFRSFIDLDEFPKHLVGQVPILRLEASKIDKIDRWEPDRIVLNEFFREVLSLQSADNKLPTEDELTRGILEVFDAGPIHLWVVFGLQLFLDTQRMLGNSRTSVLTSGADYCVRRTRHEGITRTRSIWQYLQEHR